MCSPTTVANTAFAAQAGGAAYSTVGAFYTAKGQQTALKSQAALDDINARMTELSAQGALQSGQRQEQASRLRTAQLKGSQKASLAANGIDVSSTDPTSTVNNILTSTDVMGEVDANTIKANAIAEAWGYRMQGTNYKNKALTERFSADSINPFLSAGSSLLTSAGSVAMNRYLMTKATG